MAKQVEELVSYSISYHSVKMHRPEDFEITAKMALAQVLQCMMRAVEAHDGFPLTEINEMSLELVSEGWDKNFVLRLKRRAGGWPSVSG